ncbi:MAG TPA: helix-turn-helix transcriptional regulator [Solirubrobacterales bacterium]|nr:helix-turn-helix transcriptional regulator [Solirubrobacterales bacterium]
MRRSERPQPALGAAVRQLREKRGRTQEEIGEAAGLTGATVSLIERGHANPTWATVRDLAEALDIPMGQLAKLADKLADAEK